MTWIHPAAVEYQRRRWTRPDDGRWFRPDAERYLHRDEGFLARPFLDERKHDWSRWTPATVAMLCRDERTRLATIAILRHAQMQIAELKRELALRRKAYNPLQPRVPRGHWDGGRWMRDRQGLDRIQLAEVRTTITDADGRPYYRPGGHHEMPEAVMKKWKLRPETRAVFRRSSTGKLGATFRNTPDGVRIGNVWDGDGGAHRVYNEAVEELSHRFFKGNGIRPDGSNMTPNQAHALLREIRLSEDPRIRDFNANVRRAQRFQRTRGGGD